MFALVIIFVFSLLIILGLIKIIDLIFNYQQQLKPVSLKWGFTSISLLLIFITSMAFVFWGSQLIINLTNNVDLAQPSFETNISIDPTDCDLLVDKIYQAENQVYKFENHRYIEEVSPLFTIKIEYQKGAEKLREQAQQYQNLKLQPTTLKTVNKIAQKLTEKAHLFEDRVQQQAGQSGTKEILKLLDKMDRVTEERFTLIDRVKQQCTNS